MAVNCSLTRLNISWMAVVLPRKVADILRPLGGMSHTCRPRTHISARRSAYEKHQFLHAMLHDWTSKSAEVTTARLRVL